MDKEMIEMLRDLNMRLAAQELAFSILVGTLDDHLPGLAEDVKSSILLVINQANPDNKELIDAIYSIAEGIET